MTRPPPDDADPLQRLIAIMARLRDPRDGCAWDLEQTFSTIAPYTVEEAYEVADAIERGDLSDLRDELGDLLLQVVFHARMAEEAGSFAFNDVAQAICDKMVRRHPHVFGDAAHRDSSEQIRAWEVIKAEERAAKDAKTSVLDGISIGLPGLSRAVKLTNRAARVGFDWADPPQVMHKVREEIAELEVEVTAGDQAKAAEELGDLLFVLANLARKMDIDPEAAIRGANAKFTRSFGHIEQTLAAQGRRPEDFDLAEMDGLWDQAKAIERAGKMNKPASVDAYIAGCRPEVQPILRAIRETVRAAAPEATETISYGMPTFRTKRIIVHFGAFKEHIGLFPPVREAELRDRAAPYSGEKQNLKFPLDQPMPLDLITDIVKVRVKAQGG